MARMYARKKGKSGSKKPLKKEIPPWLDLKAEEIEGKVLDLYNQDHSTSEIGIILRDSYGIPGVSLITGKKMTKILKERNITPDIPEDLGNLIRKALGLKKHLDANKKDVHNKRALQLTESKIRRLGKYYKREKVLPGGWEYKPELAELITITRR